MSIAIDLTYAIPSFFLFFAAIICILDGWKLAILRKRALITALRLSYKFLGIFIDKNRIAEKKKWHLSGRIPIIYGWTSLFVGLSALLNSIYYFVEFLKANAFL